MNSVEHIVNPCSAARTAGSCDNDTFQDGYQRSATAVAQKDHPEDTVDRLHHRKDDCIGDDAGIVPTQQDNQGYVQKTSCVKGQEKCTSDIDAETELNCSNSNCTRDVDNEVPAKDQENACDVASKPRCTVKEDHLKNAMKLRMPEKDVDNRRLSEQYDITKAQTFSMGSDCKPHPMEQLELSEVLDKPEHLNSMDKNYNSGNKMSNNGNIARKVSYEENSFINSRDQHPHNFYVSTITNTYTPVDMTDPDTVCGFWKFKPQWLQSFATAKTYLILFSIVGVLQGSYFTYLTCILSTLEKRYAFKSKVSGTIMMLDEITPLLFGILVGYFGGRAHRPRLVAIGMVLSSVCCFVSALPYFLYGPASHLMDTVAKNGTTKDGSFCDAEDRLVTDDCHENDKVPTMTAVGFLFLGSFLKGFGNLSYYAIGMTYLDDNAKKKSTPIYFGITMALRLFGPTLGFLMASAFLKLYEDPLTDPGFGPEDPRWIGAWWLGFVIQGSSLLVFTVPFFFFPRRLPKQRKRTFSNTKDIDMQTFSQIAAGVTDAVKRLIRNPLYVCLCFGTIFSSCGGLGYFSMMPKYMEFQFRLAASDASLLSGPPALVSVQVSTLLGGILVWKWKPSPRMLIGGQLFTEVFIAICYMILTIPSCDNSLMPGTHIVEGMLELRNECNANCSCETTVFNPVCGPDGISTFFSPCHAGCLVSRDDDGKNKTFTNCTCLYDSNASIWTTDSAKHGYCPNDSCFSQAMVYVTMQVVLSLVTNIFRVGHIMTLLRSVQPQDKSVALGMFESLICALAFIPYPIIYGTLVDTACIVWEKSCGRTGNCWLYDIQKYKYLLHGMAAILTTAGAVIYIGAFFRSNLVQDLYNDDTDEFLQDSTVASRKRSYLSDDKINREKY